MSQSKTESKVKLARGRPPFEPADEHFELVELLAACGITEPNMCLFVKDKNGKPITINTLKKYFSEQLETGHQKALFQMAQTLYKKALDGDTACMIFWLKTQGGWAQTIRLGNAQGKGENGAPQAESLVVELVRFSDANDTPSK